MLSNHDDNPIYIGVHETINEWKVRNKIHKTCVIQKVLAIKAGETYMSCAIKN